jgi:5'-3' exonuclease
MGVRGLLSYLKSCHVIHHADTKITGWTFGLDGFSLLYLFKEEREDFKNYLTTMKTKGSLTVVMDKRAAKEKKQVVEERKEARKEAKAEANALVSTLACAELDEKQKEILQKAIAQKERQAWGLYPAYMKWLLEVLEALEIPVVWAEEEADEVLAAGDYDAVVSSDSDLLILGVRRLWLPRGVGIQHNEVCGDAFLKLVGLKGDQLLELSYLAGCDVQPRSLMSVKEAIGRLRFYGSMEALRLRHPELVSEEDMKGYENLRTGVWRRSL